MPNRHALNRFPMWWKNDEQMSKTSKLDWCTANKCWWSRCVAIGQHNDPICQTMVRFLYLARAEWLGRARKIINVEICKYIRDFVNWIKMCFAFRKMRYDDNSPIERLVFECSVRSMNQMFVVWTCSQLLFNVSAVSMTPRYYFCFGRHFFFGGEISQESNRTPRTKTLKFLGHVLKWPNNTFWILLCRELDFYNFPFKAHWEHHKPSPWRGVWRVGPGSPL